MDTKELNDYGEFITLNLTGGKGSGAKLTCSLDYNGGGYIRSFEVNQVGSGYSAGQYVYLSSEYTSLSQALFLITSVDESGGVLTIEVGNQGWGYQVPSITDAATTPTAPSDATGLTIDVVFHYPLLSLDILSGGHDYLSYNDYSVGFPILNFLPANSDDDRPDINIIVNDGVITDVYFSGGGFLVAPEIEVVTRSVADAQTLAWNLLTYDRSRLIPRLKEVVQEYRQINVIYPESFDIMDTIDNAIDSLDYAE